MRRLAPLALLLVLASDALAAGGAARVTTDSLEYCEELSLRLGGLPRAVEQLPRTLAEEGRRLCATGHVRTGIAKLRRAIRAAQPETRGG
ncbi:MAG: hypothetical protein MUF65_13400 [Rubritepida sp.]|nr:hypothetical protein [Rubritepida sp.]MCU0946345.1 hypothetical protein [Rubritepida sp.]